MLFHELGHCFIHKLDLPMSGREDDVADQIATMLMTNSASPDLARQVAEAALFFVQLAGSPE